MKQTGVCYTQDGVVVNGFVDGEAIFHFCGRRCIQLTRLPPVAQALPS